MAMVGRVRWRVREMRLVRKLLATESELLRKHLLRLSPEDRTMRFGGSLSDAAIAEYCARFDWRRDSAFGLFEAGVLRGVAELRFAGAASSSAEIAISVERLWQNQGVGFELLRRALITACNRRVRTVHMTCLLDNPRMQHLASKFSDLNLRGGMAEADIDIPDPSPLSLYHEVVADGLALLGSWLDLGNVLR